jgi:hypothetical protein
METELNLETQETDTSFVDTAEANDAHGLSIFETVLVWLALALWITFFLIGTLVDSTPYREGFAALSGDFLTLLGLGFAAAATYTLTNVGILCILSGLLGALGAKAILGPEANPYKDMTSPRSSAVLRSFLVYLALLSGILIFGSNPIDVTQARYVKTAGIVSVIGFIVSYRPSLFGSILARIGRVLAGESSSS